MKEFTLAKADEGRRLDKWVKQNLPGLNHALLQKFLRLKRIKRNGKSAHADDRLAEGDVLRFYIEDAFFEKTEKKDKLLDGFRYRVDVVYEDENILLLDKRPGLLCHPDENEKVNTLLTHARAYLYQKGEISPGGFMPVLVNRIDRFTGGIVICAKTEAAMHILSDKIRLREIEKAYLCLVKGHMTPKDGEIKGYILKDKGKTHVQAREQGAEKGQYAETHYKTLASKNGLSLLECVLITGRTHQIRAQLAMKGHPLVGDAAYGGEKSERHSYQALYSYRITFAFQTDAGILNGLKGKSFSVKNVPFAKEVLSDGKVR